jgi:arylsulfatase A-like enzyme
VKYILLSVGLLCVLFIPTPLQAQSKKPLSQKPNILCILVDDLGFADLPAYGSKDLYTPHIDALIQAGVKFQNFMPIHRYALLPELPYSPGKYPDLAGVPGVIRTNPYDSWGYLSPKARLLPLLLKEKGYHTSLVGKWHLGLESPNTPTQRGFDHFHGFLGDMMDDYYTHLRDGNNFMRMNNQVIQPEGHATDLFSQWAIDYLASRKGKKEPFFLYLAYNAPHVPVQPPPVWLEKCSNGKRVFLRNGLNW